MAGTVANDGKWKSFANGQILYGPSGSGQNLNTDLQSNLANELDAIHQEVFGDVVVSGLVVAAGVGLAVTITAGVGYAAGQRVKTTAAGGVGSLTPSTAGLKIYFEPKTPWSTANKAWDGNFGFTAGALVAGQVLLALVNTDGSNVTLVTDSRLLLSTGPWVAKAGDTMTGTLTINGGRLLIGTAVISGASVGDIVFAYNHYFRSVNQAGNANPGMIGFGTVGAVPDVVNIAPGNALAIGTPGAMVGASAGDLVLANSKFLRFSNVAGTVAAGVLFYGNVGGTNDIVQLGPASIVAIGTPGSTAGTGTGDLVLGNNKAIRWANAAGSSGSQAWVYLDPTDNLVFGNSNAAKWFIAPSGLFVSASAASTSGALGTDILLSNAGRLLVVNGAGTGTIRIAESGPSDSVAIGGAPSIIRLGNPQTVSGAAGGDLVIANNSVIRFANAAGSSALSALNLNASNILVIAGGGMDTQTAGILHLKGGSAFSVSSPSLRFDNNRVAVFRDAAGGETNCGFIGMDTTNNLILGSGNSSRYAIDVSGHLLPLADASYDHGSTTNRIRDLCLSSSVRIGTNVAASGAIRLANNVEIVARNGANSGDISILKVDSSNSLILSTAGAAHILPGIDAGVDFGSSANRLRDIYSSSSVKIGTNPSSTGALRLASQGKIISRNAANGADLELMSADSSDRTAIGAGTTNIRMVNQVRCDLDSTGRLVIPVGSGKYAT